MQRYKYNEKIAMRKERGGGGLKFALHNKQYTGKAHKVTKSILSKKNLHISIKLISRPGADLGFSRGTGGGGVYFQKKIEHFDDLFFRSTKLIFRALPKHCFAPILAKFLKKQSKKPFLGTF